MTATPRAVELVETAALAAADKLADGIIAYDVSDQLVITDAFLLCSAPNDRQVRSIVDEIELRMRQAGAAPYEVTLCHSTRIARIIVCTTL